MNQPVLQGSGVGRNCFRSFLSEREEQVDDNEASEFSDQNKFPRYQSLLTIQLLEYTITASAGRPQKSGPLQMAVSRKQERCKTLDPKTPVLKV